MTTFKEQIGVDNINTFINILEYADRHKFMDAEINAIVQDITIDDKLSGDGGGYYAAVYGQRLQVNCLKDDLPETPAQSQAVWLDDKLYLVEAVSDELGILNINLVANER